MGKALIASVVAFVLSVGVIVMDLLGARPPFFAAIVPFLILWPAFFAVLYTINDGKLGSIPLGRLWAVLRALPRTVLAPLGIAAVTMIAGSYWADLHPGVISDRGEVRSFAGVVAWVSAVAAVLAVGIQRQRQQPAENVPRSVRLLNNPWVGIGSPRSSRCP